MDQMYDEGSTEKTERTQIFSINKKNFGELVNEKVIETLNITKQFLKTDGSRVKLVKEPSIRSLLITNNSYRPLDQLSLTESELKETHSRILSAESDFVPRNLVMFSHKNKKFYEYVEEDRSSIIFELTGNLVQKGSVDAIEYLNHSQAVAKAKSSKTKSNQIYIDEYIDENGHVSYRLLKNKFNFCDRPIMTYNYPKIEIGVNTEPVLKKTFSDTASPTVIFEAYKADYKLKIDEVKRKSKLKVKPVKAKYEPTDIDTRLRKSGIIIERMMLQNFYDSEVQDYKYYEDAADKIRDNSGGCLLPLWKFSCSLTKRKCVTSICWHSKYTDMFAVGIGSYDFGDKTKGYILIYNLIDPNRYQTKFESDTGCMSLEFHKECSYLLAAGFYDGSVMIYDLRINNKVDRFVFDKEVKTHIDPVWCVKWQKNTVEDYRAFYSISSDGMIINWILKQNVIFSYVTVRLKHIDLDTESFINEPLNAGTCFDFNTKPDDIFIVGTENGKIFEYSTQYTDKLHTVFEAHSMPVYALKWNIFHKKVFISCSADYSVHIWDHRVKNPIYSFDLGEPVADVDWAPYSSTIFVAITVNGLVNVYDISVDSENPLCSQNILTKNRRQLTHVKFNPKTPILLVSDNRGSIYSLKLSPNLRLPPKDDRHQKISVLNKENFEIVKLTSLINDRKKECGYEKVRTTRKTFDFVEVKVQKHFGLVEEENDAEL